LFLFQQQLRHILIVEESYFSLSIKNIVFGFEISEKYLENVS